MSQYRISTISTSLNQINSLNKTKYDYQNTMQQISLGVNYLKRSDAPSETNEISGLKMDMSAIEQWQKNLETASGWEAATESFMNTILDQVHRARELTVEANNGILSEQDLMNLAVDIDGIIESLYALSNSQYVGTPLFSGTGIVPPHPEPWSEISSVPSGGPVYSDDPNTGDPGMPSNHNWDDLTFEEYTSWQQQAGSSYDPGWDYENNQPDPWDSSQPKPVAGMSGMPTGHSWDELTEEEFDSWLQSREKVAQNDPDYTGSYTTSYQWDGTENPENISPLSNSDLFREIFFNDTEGKAFSAEYNSAGEITSVSYNGSDDYRSVQYASNGTTTTYGVTGAGEAGLFIVTDENDQETLSIFSTLIELRDSLAIGAQPTDEIIRDIEQIDDHIISKTVQNAVSQNKLSSLSAAATSSYTATFSRLSDLEDLDIALATVQLSSLETSYSATLQMISRVNSLSLLDYL